MSDKVSLMLKVDAEVKELLVLCAKADRRTMSAFVERLIECSAESMGISLSIDDEGVVCDE